MRLSVFETNSSSTHSLILCDDEAYKKVIAEELFIDYGEEALITKEEFIRALLRAREEGGYWPEGAPLDCELETMSGRELSRLADRMYVRICSIDAFWGAERDYTTKDGNVIHAFGIEYED